MNLNALLAALAVFIQPLLNYGEQKLESIGAAFAGTMGTIVNTMTNDQRAIGANVTAYWHAQYNAAVAAADAAANAASPGATASLEDKLKAIGTASTHTLGEFIKEEGQEGSKVVQLVITGLEIAIENGLKTP